MVFRVPAVQSAIRILEYLQEHPDDRCLLSDITRALQLNKSTCHGILKTLQAGGYVVHDEQMKAYRLGPALISLGASASGGSNVVAIALSYAQRLVQEIEFACLIVQLLPNGQIVVVEKAESLKDIKVTAAVGARFPIAAGALGKSFLAWMPRSEARARLEEAGLSRYTPNSITAVEAFMGELELVRAAGYSESRGEYFARNSAVASPVFGSDGQVILVLCVLGFSSDLTDDLLPHYGQKLRHTCAAITKAIGGRVPAGRSQPDLAPVPAQAPA